MNVDMHMKAVRRYGALIGDLDAPSQEEYVQAIVDRESYGEYIPKGQGWCGSCTRFATSLYGTRANARSSSSGPTNRSHEVFLKLASHAAAEIAKE
jgi:hypothetical protein